MAFFFFCSVHSISISSSPPHGWSCCFSLKKKIKKRRKKCCDVERRKKKNQQKKKKREVMMLSARCVEKKIKKKIERNLMYLGLDYFDAIFDFLLRCWLEMGGYKIEGLHLLLIKVKLFSNLFLFSCLGFLVSYYTHTKNKIKKFNIYLSIFGIFLL